MTSSKTRAYRIDEQIFTYRVNATRSIETIFFRSVDCQAEGERHFETFVLLCRATLMLSAVEFRLCYSPLGARPTRLLRLDSRFTRVTALLIWFSVELHVARGARQ